MANVGLDPSVLVAPDYQTQMLQAQRRLALSSALQQQAITDTPGNGGSISWTQGLARVLDGLFAGKMARKGYQQMQGANQGYAAGLRSMFGMPSGAPQTAQGASPPQTGTPPPAPPPQVPQGASAAPQVDPQADPLAPLPAAPPQAASPPPSASSPAPTGGANTQSPMSLTGDPRRDMALYISNPDEYTKQLAAVAAKGATPTDTEIMMSHARQLAAQGDYQGAAMLQQQAQKEGYIPPVAVRPGAPLYDPVQHKIIFQAARVGEGQGADYQTNPQTGQIEPSRVYNIPGATEAAAAQAGAVSGAQAGARAPYDTIQIWDQNRGQMVTVPKSAVTGGGGPLGAHYGASPTGLPAAPQLGAPEAAATYGKGSAQGALETQNSAEGSQIRVQAYREMQSLLNGGLQTGPTKARMQELAEEHGLSFLANDNAFVFNKDAALAVAQQAKALGLNSSDARFEAVARATPNMKMTPQALAQVIPVRIGMEYASQAEATANANWVAQHGPQTNPQFKNFWRQNYDPRMFTAYAQGGAQALVKAPASLRQQWLNDYRNLKAMGFSFGQLAQ